MQDYFRAALSCDIEQIQSGHLELPGLKKLITTICKNLNR